MSACEYTPCDLCGYRPTRMLETQSGNSHNKWDMYCSRSNNRTSIQAYVVADSIYLHSLDTG